MRFRTLAAVALCSSLTAAALIQGVAFAEDLGGIGTPPRPAELAQSWCAHMHLTRHVLELGGKATITGQAENTGLCVPDSWSWVDFEGLKPTKPCPDGNTTTCAFKAVAPTGKPGERFVQGCIDGTSTFGAWTSCDYYAVLPHCTGHPRFKLTHKRVHGATLVRFRGYGWDTKDCGAVTVSSAENGVPVETFNKPDFEGQLTVRGRYVCGLELFAQQAPDTVRKASFSLGKRTPYVISFLRPASITKNEETFEPGVVLCQNDLPTGGPGPSINEFAANIGAELVGVTGFERSGLYNHTTWNYLGDATGNVRVIGLSGEGQPAAAASLGNEVVTDFTATVIQTPVSSPTFRGRYRALSDLTVYGDLDLNDGVLYVAGNLNVTGAIVGAGEVIAGGNITAAGANLQSPWVYGLVAGGRLNLP